MHFNMIGIEAKQSVGGHFSKLCLVEQTGFLKRLDANTEATSHIIPVENIITHQGFNHLTHQFLLSRQAVTSLGIQMPLTYQINILTEVATILCIGIVELADACYAKSIDLSRGAASAIALEIATASSSVGNTKWSSPTG